MLSHILESKTVVLDGWKCAVTQPREQDFCQVGGGVLSYNLENKSSAGWVEVCCRTA